ncbi:MAG: hypothetical protein KAS15_01415 [Nanoarchaeota archaeon]|nr:hypothetical protein [Nanoarchaeota archaeon]
MNMFKKLWKKKGVSPLIATVLLIAFAVSLGAVVMNWGRGYVETTMTQADVQSAEKLVCSMETGFKIVEVRDTQRLCKNPTEDTLQFTMINTGTADLIGMKIFTIPSDINDAPIATTVYHNGTKTSIPKSGYLQGNLTLPYELNETAVIEIAPVILIKGVETVCLEHAIQRTPAEIGDC